MMLDNHCRAASEGDKSYCNTLQMKTYFNYVSYSYIFLSRHVAINFTNFHAFSPAKGKQFHATATTVEDLSYILNGLNLQMQQDKTKK